MVRTAYPTKPMRYLITLTKQANGYQAVIKQTGKQARQLDNLRLDENDGITIKKQSMSLGEIITALQTYDTDWLADWFDERGQLELGRYLYAQLFADQLPDNQAELCIISDDEHINHLPWLLLARDTFLNLAGWSIVLSPDDVFENLELPPSPRLLIVAPEPDDVSLTGATEHIHDLEKMLTDADSTLKPVIVNTWQAFVKEVKRQAPDVLYYYGHGISDTHSTKLVFANEFNQQLDVPVVDLIPHLINKPPRLVYFNCCFGDTGGLLGVGKQFSRFIPAVLTNRTIAMIDTAQAQALSFWHATLLDGIAPHQALAAQREQLAEWNLSVGDIRWITPVLHRHYEQWSANPPKKFHGWQRDPHWNLRLDRIKQFTRVYYDTEEMLRNNKPKALAYLWYGLANQGVEIFHQRLKIELQEKSANTRLIEISPEWSPISGENFEDMLAQAFAIKNLDYLGAKIRELTRGSSASKTLIYVRHEPISFHFTDETKFHPKHLAAYLKWWNHRFIAQLPQSCHALLGVSYQVTEPTRFSDGLNKNGLDDVELSDTAFCLLDELEKISKKDLSEFIKKHNILLPADIKNTVIADILDSTQGDYHKVLDELQDIERKGLQQLSKKQADNDNW